MPSSLPTARRTDLIVQEMDGEVVLYDSISDRANVLNRTAAVIWNLSDGATSVNDIALRASRELDAPVDAKLVWYTLEQLSKKNLMQSPVAPPAPLRGMTRRDFLRAGAVGAAVVLPVIVTMTAPAVSSAASCIASGQQCFSGTQCCSENCIQNTCA